MALPHRPALVRPRRLGSTSQGRRWRHCISHQLRASRPRTTYAAGRGLALTRRATLHAMTSRARTAPGPATICRRPLRASAAATTDSEPCHLWPDAAVPTVLRLPPPALPGRLPGPIAGHCAASPADFSTDTTPGRRGTTTQGDAAEHHPALSDCTPQSTCTHSDCAPQPLPILARATTGDTRTPDPPTNEYPPHRAPSRRLANTPPIATRPADSTGPVLTSDLAPCRPSERPLVWPCLCRQTSPTESGRCIASRQPTRSPARSSLCDLPRQPEPSAIWAPLATSRRTARLIQARRQLQPTSGRSTSTDQPLQNLPALSSAARQASTLEAMAGPRRSRRQARRTPSLQASGHYD